MKLSQELIKEEQKERDKAKKEQKEMLSLQQSITREMERQKNLSINHISLARQDQFTAVQKTYDVFVSHASEDKAGFVRPFVNHLKAKNVAVWYDEFELQVGDSLRRSIDNGLKNSKYGIVVLSEAFFKKEWPQRELDGLFAREVNGEKVILPIWHKISKNEVMSYSPIIADLLAINTTDFTIEEIAEQIAKRINR
ncbi:MAG: toll/interleukin-1 receptor domain-containing protein [Bacteroidales bacterium]|nr:toll/interleukin-1 receptor domain-containing protein [Bacteroidales bacterium]